jgi:formate-dependent nitrite reductase cytochrome c552 subunit
MVPLGAVLALGGIVYVVVLILFAVSPKTTRVRYQPTQPVPYSHAVHAGKLGMDCRYCHTTVETSAQASLPPTQTCMNCHSSVFTESEKLALVRESNAAGKPIMWARVHNLPDFAYFNHSAHVTRGIGCVSCHGRIDKMDVVFQAEPLTMGWCLSCHRQPEKYLRPKDAVTSMDYTPSGDQLAIGKALRDEYDINPPTDCSTCHR